MTAGITGTAHTVNAATVMGLLPVRPRLLALGEPTHGEDVLLELRNDLFRQLVEQERYRTIAIESDCMMGLVVDDYVTSGTGTLDEVMERGFSHEWGAFAANRELVHWMRAYNDGRPPSEQLRFAGFDGVCFAGCGFGLYWSPSKPNSRALRITFAAIGAAVRAPYPPPSTTTEIDSVGRSSGAIVMNQLSVLSYITGTLYSSHLPSAFRLRRFSVFSLPVFSS